MAWGLLPPSLFSAMSVVSPALAAGLLERDVGVFIAVCTMVEPGIVPDHLMGTSSGIVSEHLMNICAWIGPPNGYPALSAYEVEVRPILVLNSEDWQQYRFDNPAMCNTAAESLHTPPTVSFGVNSSLALSILIAWT